MRRAVLVVSILVRLLARLAVPYYLIIAISIPFVAARAQTNPPTEAGSTLGPLWDAQDLGNPIASGWSVFKDGRFVVAAGGEDITGASDQFRFVFQKLNGNVLIKARVDSLTPIQGLAKAGLMIRSSLDPAAAHGTVLINAGGELDFLRRQQSGMWAQGLSAKVNAVFPQWMALLRMGSRVIAYSSSDGNTWTPIGSAAIELDETVYVGIAVTSNDVAVRTVAEISQVSVSGLPPQQQQRNIGEPATLGSAWYTNGRYTITGGGTIGEMQDQFNLVYQPMKGDVDIVARIAYLSDTNHSAKAGVMIRESLTAGSPHAFAFVSAGLGYAFDRRDRLGSSSEHIDGGSGTAPGWVRLVRSGNSIEAFRSQDGQMWTSMGSTSLLMNEQVYVGLAITSDDVDRAATAVLEQVRIAPIESDIIADPVPGPTFTAPASIEVKALASDPEPALAQITFSAEVNSLGAASTSLDIGAPAIVGTTQYASGTFTVEGAGVDVWGTSDQFRYVYQAFTGDVEITSRVVSLENTNPFAKAGVMIRETLAANAVHTSLTVTPSNGARFYRRLTTGGTTLSTPVGPAGAPHWVRLERRGSTVTGYQSSDGVTWTAVGTATMATATMYVGLEVGSVNPAQAATAVFDNVTVGVPSGNQAPTVSLTAPASGATFTAPATITMSATASDTDGTVTVVEFYRGGTTLIGSDTTSPYSVTWSNAPAGTYSLTAIARDNTSAATTSAARSITVTAPNQAPTVALTAPANGATFPAPATITLSATASDTDGTVTVVEFYRGGTTLIGSDTTSPYSVTWSNAPAGTYSLTAIARDNTSAATTSAARSITVTAPNQAPTVALTAPANGATFPAPATITLSATASDTDGTVTVVEFYRGGTTLIGSDTTSPYSVTWSNAPAGTYSLTAVARDNTSVATTSAARSITVTGSGMPAGWTAADIGAPAIVGTTQYASGTFTVEGAGVDVWGTSDQFRYVYQAFTGDVEITSRVVSLENTNPFAKAGVMIRETLAANAVHTSLTVTPSNGARFYRRLTTGGTTLSTPVGPAGAPHWVRLERRGSTVTGYQSSDGVTWTAVGTATMATATMYVGLEVGSVNPAQAATAVFDNVTVGVPSGNQAPTVSLTAPASGATFTAPATMTLSATASDPENRLARVEFYRGSTLLGTDSASPYSVTWSSAPAGSYTLTAVAFDADGASTTSATVNITVNPTSAPPRTVIFTASIDHDTNVTSYLLKVFASGVDPVTGVPTASSNLGKPTPNANREVTVDQTSFFNALSPGNYMVTVSAVGPGGSAQSQAIAFTR